VSDKKREIIFEAPKASIPKSVKELMEMAEERMKAAGEVASDLLGEPLEIAFHIQNNRVLFSMDDTGDAAPSIAKSVIKAVQTYDVKPLDAKPLTKISYRVGSSTVTYDRHVRIDWQQKIIFTNFPTDEGSVFLAAMAIVVESLQKGGKKVEESKS